MGDLITIDGADEDLALSKSEFLTRQEVLRRRSRRVKQLARLYKAHYWSLMEELKRKHKEYYWLYGKSPFKEDEKKNGEEDDENKLGFHLKCQISDCKEKAMVLTRFCHKHILKDSNQTLYRGCSFPIKSDIRSLARANLRIPTSVLWMEEDIWLGRLFENLNMLSLLKL